MATLQKFKLLATQCAVAGSPTRSPSASPVIHLRRRKTLRMLLSRPERRRLPRRDTPSEIRDFDGDGSDGDDDDGDPPEKRKEVRVRHKLKDLFVSSPPPIDDKRGRQEEEQRGWLLPQNGGVGGPFGGRGGGFSIRRGGVGSLRPVTATFRYRFLRRAWRPVLVTIPE